MMKIRMIGPKSLTEQTTDLLQASGLVHIESLPYPTEAGRVEPFSLDRQHAEKKAELERILKDLNRLVLALPEMRRPDQIPERYDYYAVMDEKIIAQIRQALEGSSVEIESVLKEIRECEEEQSLLIRYERVLEAMAPLLREIQDVKGLDFVGLVLEASAIEATTGGGRGTVLQQIREALSELTENRYELFVSRVDPEAYAGLLVIPREFSSRIRSFLWEENISELRLPTSVADQPVGQALKVLLRRRVELPMKLQQLHGILRELSLRLRGRFLFYRRVVENWLAQLESTVYFYQTRATFLIYGWIPAAEFVRLEWDLAESFHGRVVLEQIGVTQEEMKIIPVALKNPVLLQPFEVFTKLVALPRYGSIDPTPYLAFFFPLFYGLILGDIGYGLILLAGSLYARRRWGTWPLVRNLSAIFTLSSFSAIVFGALYGEFFGALGERLGIHPLLLNRMEGFLLLLKITLVIGLVHVVLGVALGLVTAVRHQDYREMSLKGFGLGFLLGLMIMAGAFMDLIPRFLAAAGGIVGMVSLVLLFFLGGARGAMELHNVINVLSYLRLMGIGVASAALAFTANTLAGLVGNVVVGVLVGLIFHFINLVFGVFSPAIQSLRLHYVEFFENFFQAGGREYRPFKRI